MTRSRQAYRKRPRIDGARRTLCDRRLLFRHAIFESGAILLCLADKSGMLLPTAPRRRQVVVQWLFWQARGLGPMSGQAGHFRACAPSPRPYAEARYVAETARLFRVLDARLRDHEFIADDYSIADIACYPWVVPHAGLGQSLDNFPNLSRWFAAISNRPATRRAYAGVEDVYAGGRRTLSVAERWALFGSPPARRRAEQ